MNSQASSETLLGAVQHWVITTFWMTLGLLVGPLFLLAVAFFFVAIGAGWQELHEMAVAFLVVSPFVVCFWTVMVNRWLDIRDDRESGTASPGPRGPALGAPSASWARSRSGSACPSSLSSATSSCRRGWLASATAQPGSCGSRASTSRLSPRLS